MRDCRAGRTGRLDSKGFVLSFVSKRDAAVAAAVRASLSAGLSTEGIDGRVPRPKSSVGYQCEPLPDCRLYHYSQVAHAPMAVRPASLRLDGC